jgi:hypothetical protein
MSPEETVFAILAASLGEAFAGAFAGETPAGDRRNRTFLRRLAVATARECRRDAAGEKTRVSGERTPSKRSFALTKFLGDCAFRLSVPTRRPSLRVPDSADRDPGDAGRPSSDFAAPSSALWFLSRHCPEAWRVKWRRAFVSSAHGASFATFLSKTEDVGPTLVVIVAETGEIFGGICSHSLASNSADFFGDERCFVFSLGAFDGERADDADDADADEDDLDASPGFDFGVFAGADAANRHFCYCASGFTSDRFPNGLGFGGQVGHHAVFLDASFETGHCRASAATFGNARVLSGKPRREALGAGGSRGDAAENGNGDVAFVVRAVEAWAVDADFHARLQEQRRLENRRGAGGREGEGVRGARHAEARMLMESARRDAGGAERQDR